MASSATVSVALLLPDNALGSAVAAMADMFRAANRFAPEGVRFHTEVVAPDPAARPFGEGLSFRPGPSEARYDLAILPPVMGQEAFPLEANTGAWLQRAAAEGTTLCSVCASAFFLAEAGVLEGKTATTHWSLEERFRSRFPHIPLEINRLLIDHGKVITCGGVTAYNELVLHLVARYASVEAAFGLARLLLIDPGRASQALYKGMETRIVTGDREIAGLAAWMEEHLEREITVEGLAARAGMAPRTLLRRFKNATGKLPSVHLQDLRVERAKTLLATTAFSFPEITDRCGYRDVSSFRRLFSEKAGVSPGTYRKRFALFG